MIEVVNEPYGLDLDFLKNFTSAAITDIHNANPNVTIAFSDEFVGLSTWSDFKPVPEATTILDEHRYQIFTPAEQNLTLEDRIAGVCGIGTEMKYFPGSVVLGEWSGAMTDCAQYLNGYQAGARQDGSYPGGTFVASCDGKSTGNATDWPDSLKTDTRKFLEAQMDAFEQGDGWTYWPWKVERGAPEWDMKKLIAAGVFPQPLTSRQFPNQCGF